MAPPTETHAPAPHAQDGLPGTAREADAYLHEQVARYRMPGAQAAVVQRGETVLLTSYGVANVEFDVPMTAARLLPLASVTKIFAGLAAVALWTDGTLDLDAPASALLPELPAAWSGVTLRRLLSHTAGIQNVSKSPEWAAIAGRETPPTFAEFVDVLSRLGLGSPPGTRFSYTFSAYTLVQAALERASGMPFPDLLRTRFFEPLGMDSCVFGDSRQVIPNKNATNYSFQDGPLAPWTMQYGPETYAAAGLNLCARDMARLFAALQHGRVLAPAALAELWRPAQLNDGSTAGYALGWTVEDHRGQRVVGHEGGGCAWAAHYPEHALSIVFLCNLSGARADDVPRGLADLFLNA